jgi:4-amino-4-deoxy-L-arabinose transferase-like glycosyltransferase
VFPLAIVVLYLIGARKTNHLLRWYPILAVLVFLAILMPEHIAARIATGHAHLASLMPAFSGGRVPLWIFWPLLLLWIVPWSAFSIRALRIGDSPLPGLRRQARLLCVIWILVVLVGFSATARLEFNLMTALPPMALLAGGWLADDEARPHHQGRIAAWIVFGIGMAAAGLVAYYLFTSPVPAPGVDIATLLRPNGGEHAVFFGWFLNLTHRAMGAFKVPLAITLAALIVGVSAGLWFRLRDNARMANCFLAGMIVTILIAAHIAIVTFSPVLSSEILAEAIKPEVQPSDVIVVNGPFESASSFAFYLDRQVLIVSEPGGTPTAGAPFIDDAQLAALWNGPNRVWLWTTPANAPALPAPVDVIGRSGGKEVVSNEPNSGGASF